MQTTHVITSLKSLTYVFNFFAPNIFQLFKMKNPRVLSELCPVLCLQILRYKLNSRPCGLKTYQDMSIWFKAYSNLCVAQSAPRATDLKPAAIILIFFTFYHHLPQESLYRFLISSFSLNVSITFSLCYCLFFPYDSFLLQLSNESFICFLS